MGYINWEIDKQNRWAGKIIINGCKKQQCLVYGIWEDFLPFKKLHNKLFFNEY